MAGRQEDTAVDDVGVGAPQPAGQGDFDEFGLFSGGNAETKSEGKKPRLLTLAQHLKGREDANLPTGIKELRERRSFDKSNSMEEMTPTEAALDLDGQDTVTRLSAVGKRRLRVLCSFLRANSGREFCLLFVIFIVGSILASVALDNAASSGVSRAVQSCMQASSVLGSVVMEARLGAALDTVEMYGRSLSSSRGDTHWNPYAALSDASGLSDSAASSLDPVFQALLNDTHVREVIVWAFNASDAKFVMGAGVAEDDSVAVWQERPGECAQYVLDETTGRRELPAVSTACKDLSGHEEALLVPALAGVAGVRYLRNGSFVTADGAEVLAAHYKHVEAGVTYVVATSVLLTDISDALNSELETSGGDIFTHGSDSASVFVIDDRGDIVVSSTTSAASTVEDARASVLERYPALSDIPATVGDAPFEAYVGHGHRPQRIRATVVSLRALCTSLPRKLFVVTAATKEDFYYYRDKAILFSVVSFTVSLAALSLIFLAMWREERSVDRIQRHIDSGIIDRIEYESLVKRSHGLSWAPIAIFLVFFCCGMCNFVYWRYGAAGNVEDLASQLSSTLEGAHRLRVDSHVAHLEGRMRLASVENTRKAADGGAPYLVHFAAEAASDIAGQAPPRTGVPGSLSAFFADAVATTLNSRFSVDYFGVGLSNGLATLARVNESSAVECMVLDNATAVHRVPVLQAFPVGADGAPRRDGQSMSLASPSLFDLNNTDWYAEGGSMRDDVSSWAPPRRLNLTAEARLGVELVSRSATHFSSAGTRAGSAVFVLGASFAKIRENLLPQLATTSSYAAVFVTRRSSSALFDELVIASEGAFVSASEGPLLAEDAGSGEVAAIAKELNLRVQSDLAEPAAERRFEEGVGTTSFDGFIDARYGADAVWVSLATVRGAYGLAWNVVTVTRQHYFFRRMTELTALGFLMVIGGLAMIGLPLLYFERSLWSQRQNLKHRVQEKLSRYVKQKGRTPFGPQSRAFAKQAWVREALELTGDEFASNYFTAEDWSRFASEVKKKVLAAAKSHTSHEPMNRARQYLIDAYSFPDRRIMDTLYHEAQGPFSLLPACVRRLVPYQLGHHLSMRTIYMFYTGPTYRTLTFAFMITHILLTFWEAPIEDEARGAHREYTIGLLALNGFLTLWNVFDTMLRMLLSGGGIRKINADIRRIDGWHVSKILCLRILCSVAMLFDWLCLAGLNYVDNDRLFPDKESLFDRTRLPWSSPFRGFALLLRHTEVQAALASFVVTIVRSTDVMVVGFSFVTIAVCMGICILRNIYDESAMGRNTDDYRSAYIHFFVLVITGSNYPDAVFPSYEHSRLFRSFFMVFGIIGTFFLVALIIASFQDTYTKHMQKIEDAHDTERQKATVVAFQVLKCAQEVEANKLAVTEQLKLLHFALGGGPKQKAVAPKETGAPAEAAEATLQHGMAKHFLEECGLPASVLKDMGEDTTLPEFSSIIDHFVEEDYLRLDPVSQSLREDMKAWLEAHHETIAAKEQKFFGTLKREATTASAAGFRMLHHHRTHSQASEASSRPPASRPHFWAIVGEPECMKRLQARYLRFTKTKGYQEAVRATVFVHIWVLMLLGTADGNNAATRYVLHGFVMFNVLETLLLIWAEGPAAFFFREDFAEPYKLVSQRFNALVSATTLFLLVLNYARGIYEAGGSDEPGYDGDFTFSVPCLRLVTIVHSNRDILFGLGEVLRKVLYPLAILLVIDIFLFAVVGVMFFSGYFRFQPEEVNGEPGANFNSIPEAVSTLFQIMLGENWHEIMYAAMDADYGFSAAVYFIAYVVLVSVLFANMFIGILSEAYQTLMKERKKHQAEGGNLHPTVEASADESKSGSGGVAASKAAKVALAAIRTKDVAKKLRRKLGKKKAEAENAVDELDKLRQQNMALKNRLQEMSFRVLPAAESPGGRLSVELQSYARQSLESLAEMEEADAELNN